jgi:hypothetical protein
VATQLHLGALLLVAAAFVLRALLTWIPRPWKRTGPNRRYSLANVLTRPFSLVEWMVKTYPQRFQPNAPGFDPNAWTENVDGANCYAYALNANPAHWDPLTRAWPDLGDLLPGKRTPLRQIFSWWTARRALRAEGLTPATLRSLHQSPGDRWLVAFHFDPRTRQFHVMRLDSNGRWSHKPGVRPVTQNDVRGVAIRSPRRAVLTYTYWFCGYFWVHPRTNPVRQHFYAQACIAARMAGTQDPPY